jgi:hypothetical protein
MRKDDGQSTEKQQFASLEICFTNFRHLSKGRATSVERLCDKCQKFLLTPFKPRKPGGLRVLLRLPNPPGGAIYSILTRAVRFNSPKNLIFARKNRIKRDYGTRRCFQEDSEPLQGVWLRLSKQ